MRIVKLSDLSDNERKKVLEEQQVRVEANRQASEQYRVNANNQFNSTWNRVQDIANNNLNRFNNRQSMFDRNTRNEMAKPMEDYMNTKKMAMQNASNYVQQNTKQQPVVEEKSMWDKIKDSILPDSIGMRRNDNRVKILTDSSGKILSIQNLEAEEQRLRMIKSKKAYDEKMKAYEKAMDEQLKNTLQYKSIQMQNPNATEEELIKITRERNEESSRKFIEDLSNMSPVERNITIDGFTHDKKQKYELKAKVQDVETQKEADKINQDMQNGDYWSSIGHVAKGLPEGAMNAVIKTTTALEDLSGHKTSLSSRPNYDPVQEAKLQTRKYQETTSKIDNGIVQTGSAVSNTIGEMAPAMIANVAVPGSGSVVNAVNVGSSGYLDTLNEEGNNKGQSFLTGGLKGLASFTIEKITGGNFLSEGSLDDWAAKTIANKTANKATQKIASKIYEFGGEVLEENLENQVGYIIDKVINNQNITAEQWVNDFSETTKNTILTTAVLNLLGLGGNTYKEVVDMEKNTKAKEMIKEAEKIIKKENLELNKKNIKERELRDVLNEVNVKENNQVDKTKNLQQNALANSLQSVYNDTGLNQVENVPIEEVLRFKTDGGYRNEQYMAELREDIRKNGIDNPIELVRNNDGSIEIENGNHRLQVASELGLKEVPIKFVESWENILGNIDKTENKVVKRLEVYNDRNNGNGGETNIFDGGSKINEEYSTNNWNQFKNRETTTGNDRLYNQVQTFTDRPSSTSAFEQNSKKISGLGDTSSFNMQSNNTTNLEQNGTNNEINSQTGQINQAESKMSQNGNMEQIEDGNKNIAYSNFNYYQTAKKYNLPIDNNSIKGIYEVASKRGIKVFYDDTAFSNSSQNAKWIVDSEGKRSVVLNPNANTDTAMQSVMIHELTHDFEGTKEYNRISSMVLDRLKSSNDYDSLMLDIAKAYENEYKNMSKEQFRSLIEQEAVADYLGENLGNQEFVNDLVRSTERNQIQRIIDWVKNKITSLKNTVSGNKELNYWNKIKENFERAYNQEYQGNNLNERFSIQTDKNGNQYVKVDTDQDIFDGIDKKDYNKIAKMYMQDYLKGNTTLAGNDNANIGRRGINKYTNPQQDTRFFEEKMQLTPELQNVLEIAEKVSTGNPTKETTKFPNWEYYKFNFELGGENFEGLINIGIDKEGKKHFYEINKIHNTRNIECFIETKKYYG